MKEIQLTRGKVAIVDDDIFEELSKHKWWCSGNGYATRDSSLCLGERTTIRLHREVLQTPDGMETDHINGDRLDNRRENLRVCKRSENSKNQKKRADNISGYKGVSWSKPNRKWRATIMMDYKTVHLGYFDDKQVAARAYDEAACKLYGEFARTNFQLFEEKI